VLLRRALALGAFGWAAAALAGEGMAPVYEVSIDGETFVVSDGRETELNSRATPGRSIRLLVRRKPIQPYETTRLAFEYDGSANLEDDRDVRNRTITLIALSSGVLVVSEHEEAKPSDHAGILKRYVREMSESIRRDGGAILEVSPARETSTAHARGLESSIRSRDADGELSFCSIRALASEDVVFVVVTQHVEENEDRAPAFFAHTLDSIRARARVPETRPAP
jgi:hypothetical protein